MNPSNKDPLDAFKPKVYIDVKGKSQWNKIEEKNNTITNKMFNAENNFKKICFKKNSKGSMLALKLKKYRNHCTLNLNSNILKGEEAAVYIVNKDVNLGCKKDDARTKRTKVLLLI